MQYNCCSATKRKSPSGISERAFSASVAERTLPSSNLQPLNSLEYSRLQKAFSPHKIDGLNDVALIDTLLRDLAAINQFLIYLEAEPFINSEKAQNYKRISFKKIKPT